MKTDIFLKFVVTLVAFSLPAIVLAQDAPTTTEIPSEWAPWKDPSNSDAVLLTDDKDAIYARRDRTEDPEREAGLLSPQRYAGGPAQNGFPTYLGAPLAFTTEDLVAGEVDVALVGVAMADQVIPGANFAANRMRVLTDWMSFPFQGTNNFLGVDYGKLVVADYGNVASNPLADNQRNVEELHRVLAEILAADTVPFGVGGTHLMTYAFHTALAQKYGTKSFATLHIDAHYDTYFYNFGRFVHNGSFIRIAVEQGLIEGSDIVQVGLRGEAPDDKSLGWMSDNGLKYHFQAAIERNGWDAVLQRVLDDLKGKPVHISFDMDGIDPGYAVGVGTQTPSGLTASQALQLVRAVAIQNEIIAAEFNEYNPLLDDAHTTTGVLMDRLIRSTLAGMQARREGITDPLYYDPKRLNHSD